MKIRKTKESDLPIIEKIYIRARRFMSETGNPTQWGHNNWPPVDLIKKDIKNGKSYVCVDDNDKVIGTFFYDFGKKVEKTYDIIEDGEWKGNDVYGVVHRIASDGSIKGIGSFCINWAYEQCGHLRIDTHEDNIVMQNLLNKLGFKKCGIIHIEEDDMPRTAFEK